MLVVAIVDNRKGSLPQSQKRQHERSVEIEDHDVGEALEDPCKEKWKLILWHWERERPKKLTGSFRWAEKKFEGKRDVFKRTTSSRSTEPAF
jgi:hypothetical protein